MVLARTASPRTVGRQNLILAMWRKHSIARCGSPCAATAAGGVAAHGVAAATRRLRAPGPGDVSLPQSNVRFVIFE